MRSRIVPCARALFAQDIRKCGAEAGGPVVSGAVSLFSDSGGDYDATIAMRGPNALKVQGYAFGGMFCGRPDLEARQLNNTSLF